MPENMPPIGATGRTVAAAVRELRQARGLSLRELSKRLAEIGRPILPIVLSRLENEQRRVDADDLLALCIVLGVNPNALLLPRHVDRDDIIELTPEVRQRAFVAWGWMRGRWPLPAELLPQDAALGFPAAAMADFAERTRPDFSQPDPDQAVAELIELHQLIELVLGAPDPAARWVKVRDTTLRQWRVTGIRMEELVSRLDREALDRSAFEFDTGAAVEQLRVTTERAHGPGAALSGHGTLSTGPPAAPASTVDPLDPFGKRG